MTLPTIGMACDDANDFMLCAINKIEATFGKGYASEHPELVAAFMQTAALSMSAEFIGSAGRDVAEALDNLHEPLRSDHPLQAQTLDGLERALQDIAAALADQREKV